MNRTMVTDKDNARRKVADKIAEFLRRGGKIEQVKTEAPAWAGELPDHAYGRRAVESGGLRKPKLAR